MSPARCLSSLGCPELSLDDCLALAARHGIGAVELRALGGNVDLAAYFGSQYPSPAEFGVAMRRAPVRIAALNASLHLVGGTAAERDELVRLAPWAEAAGIPRLRVFDGGRTADANELREAADTMAWWQATAAREGWRVQVMVETHDSLLGAAAIERFRAALPGVGVLWDAHHTWRKGGEDPVLTWRAIGDSVVHIHVKDSVARPSARHPFTYVLPGDGNFPIAPLLAALRADHFGGLVSLEWERLWHPYLPPLEQALQVAAARGWW